MSNSNATGHRVTPSRIIRFSVFFLGFMLLVDYYVFGGLAAISGKVWVRWAYWLLCLAGYAFLLAAFITDYRRWGRPLRDYVGGFFVAVYVFKFVFVAFLLFNDVFALGAKTLNVLWPSISGGGAQLPDVLMQRSKTLLASGAMVAFVPFAAILNGIFRNAYNYQVKRVDLPIPNLPEALEGFTIVQISDIHTGSLTKNDALLKGIDTINRLEPDVVFFTGDLVNMVAAEAVDFVDVFGKIEARQGVFSITGNHDYGDYVLWQDPDQKRQNFGLLQEVHRRMGWRLLLNENHTIGLGGAGLAVIGVENCSAQSRYPKYGNLAQACKGCHEADVKLLLSHDPSHWQAEVLPRFPQIAATFSGHTHGLQFGINLPFFKWSPVQWAYKEWYGLYTQNGQHLYVNPGFGYVGLPGRVGFLPEITHFTLTNKKY